MLEEQIHPEDEVILINDHSDAGFLVPVEEFCSAHSNFSCIDLEKHEFGKKTAVSRGAEEARKEQLLFLDADVEINADFLKSLRKSHLTDLNILPVIIDSPAYMLDKFEHTESMALAGTTGVFAMEGRAVMMNGAAYAVKSSVFQEYIKTEKGKNVSSGDDMFLLNYVRENHHEINYLSDPHLLVLSEGGSSWKSFIDQRIRWASKMIGNALPGRQMGIFILMIQVIFAAAILRFLWAGELLLLFLFWLIKAMAEFSFTREIHRHFHHQSWLNKFSFGGVLLYPFMSTFIILMCFFYKPKWKDRSIQTRNNG
jgi:glycosyltransferase involved in cell wall biosynthesis